MESNQNQAGKQATHNPEADEVSREDLEAAADLYDRLVQESLERENVRLKRALAYLSSKDNYDIYDEGYDLIRPGGARQVGIVMHSRHLAAWTFAREVLGIETLPHQESVGPFLPPRVEAEQILTARNRAASPVESQGEGAPARPEIKSWVYTLRKEDGEWLAQVVLTSDGMFAAVSDYGNFGYAWRAFGKGRDFREFLSELGPDYFSEKMMAGAVYAFGYTRKNQHACDRFTMQVLHRLKEVLKADLAALRAPSPQVPAAGAADLEAAFRAGYDAGLEHGRIGEYKPASAMLEWGRSQVPEAQETSGVDGSAHG